MKKEPKFKVGDKVLVSFPFPTAVVESARKYDGQVVEITGIRDDSFTPYLIEDYELYWPDTYFTLVEEEVKIKEITNSEVMNILES